VIWVPKRQFFLIENQVYDAAVKSNI